MVGDSVCVLHLFKHGNFERQLRLTIDDQKKIKALKKLF